jgi:uncharacterized protein (DUF169 family)
MRPLQTDLSIYKKFNLERPPVGIKYLMHKPEGYERVGKSLAFCEMLKEAHQRGKPFYFAREDENCAGAGALGMEEIGAMAYAGLLGEKFKIFQEGHANGQMVYNLFQKSPKPVKGVINYALYAPLDKLTFEPDLLVLVMPPRKAEIVLRALTYATGEVWETINTIVFDCFSLFVYPYLTGKVNYTTTGLSFGMIAKELYPEGLIIVSIPYQKLPAITQNLNEMEWTLEAYTLGREGFLEMERRIIRSAGEESKKSS